MKITVLIGDKSHRAREPFEGASHVIVVDVACPSCGAETCRVRGRECWHDHDTHHGVAVTLCCDAKIGRIDVKMDTFFGIEEDRRVLNGRWRVY